jgi:tetratricopeptide (TPR) repeat protein
VPNSQREPSPSANLEYGRAALRFRQALRVRPRDAVAHFLLAQALLALGKYPEAVDAIHAGMALRPDWPTVNFQPLELYGPNVTEYPEHLGALEATLGRHPNGPVLLFLYAYQLWFDGRKEEAWPLFRRALPRAADPGAIRPLPARPPRGAGGVTEKAEELSHETHESHEKKQKRATEAKEPDGPSCPASWLFCLLLYSCDSCVSWFFSSLWWSTTFRTDFASCCC